MSAWLSDNETKEQKKKSNIYSKQQSSKLKITWNFMKIPSVINTRLSALYQRGIRRGGAGPLTFAGAGHKVKGQISSVVRITTPITDGEKAPFV